MTPAAPFSYELPPDRIAQRPVHPADSARLLVVDRSSAIVHSTVFSRIGDWLRPGDALVFNKTRVIAARMFGILQDSEAEVEILLTREIEPRTWRALGKPLKKFKPGSRILMSHGLRALIGERISDYEVLLVFECDGGAQEAERLIKQCGIMPIPPYIREGRADEMDRIDYQSIFAEVDGSVAAPTASLHFTPELITQLEARGAVIENVTLHVGTASFLPLQMSEQGIKPPGSERYIYDSDLLQRLTKVKKNGGRVIAVGTTVVRALESMASISTADEETSLFIQPGYRFALIDAMVTNFHQPATTHLLLVEAFMGRALLERSYRYALENDCRFLSYGDGMIIV